MFLILRVPGRQTDLEKVLLMPLTSRIAVCQFHLANSPEGFECA